MNLDTSVHTGVQFLQNSNYNFDSSDLSLLYYYYYYCVFLCDEGHYFCQKFVRIVIPNLSKIYFGSLGCTNNLKSSVF